MNRITRKLFITLAAVLMVSSVNIRAHAKSVPLVKQIGTVNASSLRLRSGPSTNHATITTAPKGDYVMILGSTGSWYQVSYNLKTGYMHRNHLTAYQAENAELGYGTVTADNVNLRSGPGTGYRSLGKVSTGEKAYIIGFNRQWYKVIARDQVCYIRSDYLELTQIPYENKGSSNQPIFFVDGKSTGVAPSAQALKGSAPTATRSRIVSEAKKYQGVPYVWGGSTPSGFDCSGFVQYVLKQCSITVPRTTEQQATVGTAINKSELLPGDLVFLQNTYRSGISHVGIYIGNDRMIHASSSKGVTVSDLTSSYYIKHYHSARRLLK